MSSAYEVPPGSPLQARERVRMRKALMRPHAFTANGPQGPGKNLSSDTRMRCSHKLTPLHKAFTVSPIRGLHSNNWNSPVAAS